MERAGGLCSVLDEVFRMCSLSRQHLNKGLKDTRSEQRCLEECVTGMGNSKGNDVTLSRSCLLCSF